MTPKMRQVITTMFLIEGIGIILISVFLVVATQMALTELDRSVQDLSDIPFVGWIIGTAVNAGVSERRKEIEEFRLLGFGGILGGIFVIAVGTLMRRSKAPDNKDANLTLDSTPSASTGPTPMHPCQACGFHNGEALRFCGNCGRSLR